MKQLSTLLLCGMLAATLSASCRTPPVSQPIAVEDLGGLDGVLVVMDCSSGQTKIHRPELVDVRLPPCSTFKILNTLVGLETGLVESAEEPFYQWDGVERSFPAWNQDLSLREAFQASCVPAFQKLARQIGSERMQGWIDKVGYGNQDTSAGIDVFWLPAKGRQTILISPREQVRWIQRIVAGEVPFSEPSLAVLKDLMFLKETGKGRLYGKTGSGRSEHGTLGLGWFVGYVESHGKTHAFACAVQGDNVMGKDARLAVESFLVAQGLL
jgi:beta-lactamase class D